MAQLSFDPSKLSPADLELYNDMIERRRARAPISAVPTLRS